MVAELLSSETSSAFATYDGSLVSGVVEEECFKPNFEFETV